MSQQVIDEARAAGFMDCLAIRNALGWDKPKPNGSYYSSMQVAYHWIERAGETVVYLEPDGESGIPKTKRTGVYADVFERVLAYKVAHYAKKRHEEWSVNMADALAAREAEGAITKNMNWDVYIDGLGPEPLMGDRAILVAVQDTKDERILAALRSYTGPLNRKGLPKRRPLEAHAGFYMERRDVKRLWPQRED